MKNFKKGLFRLSAVLLVALPAMANAEVPTTLQGTRDKICDIFGWIYTFSLAVGVIFILIAAIGYITSSGDAEKVGKAKKALVYAIVGIAIALLASSAPAVIGSFLGADSAKGC